MAFAPFIPLRVLSSYSMLEAAIDPKQIAKLAKERGFPAIAICDRNGLYGAVMFAKACFDEGVQPIIGTLLGIARDTEGKQVDYLPLYAQDETGYDNLCHLVSKAHLDRPLEFEPHVRMRNLEGHTDGLIALTGAGDGALSRLLGEGQIEHGEAMLDRLQMLFPDRLYIELARCGDSIQDAAEAALIDIAYKRSLPLVATNPAFFSEPHVFKAHDAMLCIANSTHVEAEERPRSNREAFVKSAPMMEELFDDLPEATANTLTIARRCAYAPPYRDPILPSLAGDLEGEAKALADDARKGLEARLEPYGELSEEERKGYFDRLDFEVDVIVGMGFPGYFLIVADFIKWAKGEGIPVGPGRGSGCRIGGRLGAHDYRSRSASGLVCCSSVSLIPNAFRCPISTSTFCETRRGEVIRYVQQKYGEDHVAQIITFGKQ